MSECLIGGRHDGTNDSTHSYTLNLTDGNDTFASVLKDNIQSLQKNDIFSLEDLYGKDVILVSSSLI